MTDNITHGNITEVCFESDPNQLENIKLNDPVVEKFLNEMKLDKELSKLDLDKLI